MVRLPAHITDAVKRINAVREQLEAAGGGKGGEGGPTNEEVAAVLGLTASKVHFYRKVREQPKPQTQRPKLSRATCSSRSLRRHAWNMPCCWLHCTVCMPQAISKAAACRQQSCTLSAPQSVPGIEYFSEQTLPVLLNELAYYAAAQIVFCRICFP